MIPGITEEEQQIIENILKEYDKEYSFFYYGSRVKGTFEKTSDLDILIKGKQEMPLSILEEIKEKFDEEPLSFVVNFSDYFSLDEKFYKKIKDTMVPYKWKTYKLSDFIEFNPRETLAKGTIAKKIAMENLQPFCRDVCQYEYAPYNGGVKFKNGDTIMARITPCLENGKTSKINILEDDEIAFGSTEYIVFRKRDNISDENFIYYLVTSPKIREIAIKSMVGSSGRQRVQADVLANLELELPSLEIQEKIARVLSSLDDKIELNNKINQNLEQQAQAIFKSWFVDFEPFGGKMPEDWSLKTLSDISNITVGGDKPDIVSNIETEECKIPIYSNGIDNNGLYGYTTEPKILQESVTVSARGTIGFTCLRLHPYVPIVRLISLIPRTDIVSAKYLYFALLNKHITGTGTTQQQLTVPYFKTTPIIVPTFDIVNQFTEIVNSFYKIIEKNICENKRLIKLRDTLLPKLLSGEIDVDKVKV